MSARSTLCETWSPLWPVSRTVPGQHWRSCRPKPATLWTRSNSVTITCRERWTEIGGPHMALVPLRIPGDAYLPVKGHWPMFAGGSRR